MTFYLYLECKNYDSSDNMAANGGPIFSIVYIIERGSYSFLSAHVFIKIIKRVAHKP